MYYSLGLFSILRVLFSVSILHWFLKLAPEMTHISSHISLARISHMTMLNIRVFDHLLSG